MCMVGDISVEANMDNDSESIARDLVDRFLDEEFGVYRRAFRQCEEASEAAAVKVIELGNETSPKDLATLHDVVDHYLNCKTAKDRALRYSNEDVVAAHYPSVPLKTDSGPANVIPISSAINRTMIALVHQYLTSNNKFESLAGLFKAHKSMFIFLANNSPTIIDVVSHYQNCKNINHQLKSSLKSSFSADKRKASDNSNETPPTTKVFIGRIKNSVIKVPPAVSVAVAVHMEDVEDCDVTIEK
ncbi:hypothetical protein FOCC_FOCC000885 [Frankliniella occidentalis]|nr:hypothetical protein FOCC_FOCC000885 [Frankliniella occidentalis]